MKIKSLKPYLIIFYILCLSIIPCFVIFTNSNFITYGHDNVFHFSQIQDLYNAIKVDPFATLISPTLNHGVGVGTRLMYGSMSHHLVVLLGLIVIPLGGTLMLSYKLIILFSYLFANIVIYKLLKYISKNTSLALIGVALFALFPYRFANLYIRNAFSESLVISMLPLVFYGLIKWLKEDFNMSSYIMVGVGLVFIVHTHNISAVFTLLFLFIFLGVNYKKVYLNIKNSKKHRIAFTITSFGFILMCLPFFITLVESLSGNYRVFNSDIMGTNYVDLKDSYSSLFSYVIYCIQDNWKLYIITGGLFFLIPMICAYIFDNNKYRAIIFLSSYTLCAIVCSVLLSSIYVLFAFVISLIIMYFINKETNEKIDSSIKKMIFILLLVSVSLLVILPIWKILPSLFKNIQFIWRMWGFICVFVTLIVPILLQKYLKNRKRYFSYVLSSSVGLLLMISYPLSINDSYFDSNSTINEEITKNPNATGWQLEYFPEVFFDDTYDQGSPLFIDIKNAISSSEEILFEPYIYQGKAEIINYNNLKNPNITFDIECSEESVVQLPLLYYKGYKITITNSKGTTKLKTYQVDGLLSFEVNTSGTIKVDFTGSTMYQISKYMQFITIISLLGALGYYSYEYYNCKRKEKKVK